MGFTSFVFSYRHVTWLKFIWSCRFS